MALREVAKGPRDPGFRTGPHHHDRPRGTGARRVLRSVVAMAVGTALLISASACAGQKGRNDDLPGPNDYAPRLDAPPRVPGATGQR